MRKRLFERLRSESGVAIPTVMFVIVVGLAVAAVSVTASVTAQRGTVRDLDRKGALAAADSAVSLALFRKNKVATNDLLPCVLENLAGELLAGLGLGDGWCPAVSGAVGGATYTYRVKPATLIGTLQNEALVEIVGIGTSGDVTRRVEVRATAKTGNAIFGNAAVIGDESVTIDGSAGVGAVNIGTNVASNGTVSLEGSALLCGDASYGPGEAFNIDGAATWCPGFTSSEGLTGVPVPDPGDVHSINSNHRLEDGSDARQPPSGNSITWLAGPRTLELNGNSALTLGGSNYSICRLVMSGNSLLIAAQNSQVTLWFDKPENCGPLADGTEQVTMTGNSKVSATSGDPNDLRFVLEGSDERATKVNLAGNTASQNEVVIYAPRSDVILQGNATYKGAFAGKTVLVRGSPTVLKLDNLSGINIPALIHYTRDRYVECTGVSGSPPDLGC